MTRRLTRANLSVLQERISSRFFAYRAFLVFLISFFLIRTADNILTYVFPIVVESSVGSNTIMGLIMALSSVAGLVCDFVFPSLISRKNWKQIMFLAVAVALFFPLFTYLGEIFLYIGFFIIATIVWGVYFELLIFSEQNYILSGGKGRNFSKDWSLIILLISFIEIIGPILATWLLVYKKSGYLIFTTALLLFASIILTASSQKLKPEKLKVESKNREVLELLREFKMWGVLYKKVWYVLAVSLTIHSVFAAYVVFGGLFGLSLMGEKIGWVVMFLFAFPGLITYFLLTKIVVKRRKKFITHVLLITGGLMLMLLAFFNDSIVSTGMVILFSTLLFSVAEPINNAVFSDLAERLGDEKNHLFGMVNATGSIAFVVVPIVFGITSDRWGYYNSFASMGFVAFIVGIILLFTTPRKIRLPQKKIVETHIPNSIF